MGIHILRIHSGSETETKFLNTLIEVGVKPELVICRVGAAFNKNYNEYVLSDGLYKQIQEKIWKIKSEEA